MQEEHKYSFRNLVEKILHDRARRSLKWVEQVNKGVSENKFLDSRWFLDYHDDLNRLSIDEDREDTIKKQETNC